VPDLYLKAFQPALGIAESDSKAHLAVETETILYYVIAN